MLQTEPLVLAPMRSTTIQRWVGAAIWALLGIAAFCLAAPGPGEKGILSVMGGVALTAAAWLALTATKLSAVELNRIGLTHKGGLCAWTDLETVQVGSFGTCLILRWSGNRQAKFPVEYWTDESLNMLAFAACAHLPIPAIPWQEQEGGGTLQVTGEHLYQRRESQDTHFAVAAVTRLRLVKDAPGGAVPILRCEVTLTDGSRFRPGLSRTDAAELLRVMFAVRPDLAAGLRTVRET